MISQIINSYTGFIKENTKNDQLQPTVIASLTPSVLQILTDVDCAPPKALASLEKDIAYLKTRSKLSLTDKLCLGAEIVLTVATIAAAIFGKILLASSLAVLGIVTIVKFLNSLDTDKSIDKRVNTIKADLNLIGAWLKQIKARKQKNDLSIEQLKAIEEAYSFSVSQLHKASQTITL